MQVVHRLGQALASPPRSTALQNVRGMFGDSVFQNQLLVWTSLDRSCPEHGVAPPLYGFMVKIQTWSIFISALNTSARQSSSDLLRNIVRSKPRSKPRSNPRSKPRSKPPKQTPKHTPYPNIPGCPRYFRKYPYGVQAESLGLGFRISDLGCRD